MVAAAPLLQPIEFGKYTLFERIGRGGMADVFKGRVQGPAGFERVFVIKRILPHLSDEPQFIKMFINEAKMSARLNHPNVVQIFELGNVGSEYFISMEYIPGRDLAETMRAIWSRLGPPKPELVAFIGREMCRGLHYAHELLDEEGNPLNIIHRDVSPSNVMLSYEGAVKLLDFGIAKALGQAENTKGGTLKGKYAYMSPEQASGKEIALDRRIDVFAAGIVLYELTTGRRLFKSQTDMATIERVRRCDVPPPSKHNPLCTKELDDILLKALAKDRDQRYQTAAEMGDALEEIVYSARFVPAQLRQLLADLFLGDTGARIERRVSSAQRPPSSASVPPVAVTATGEREKPAPEEGGGAAPGEPGAPFTPVTPSAHSAAGAGADDSDSDADEALAPTQGGVSEQPSAASGVPSAPPPSELMESIELRVPDARPPRKGHRLAVVGGSIGLVAVALAVAFGFRLIPMGGRSAGTAAAGANRPAATAVPAVVEPVSPPPGGGPRMVEVPFGSAPEGAQVFVGERRVAAGRTPVTLPLELDDRNPVRVTLKLEGYEDHVEQITSNKPVMVALKSLKPAVSTGVDPNSATKKEKTPKKKRSSELVNPF